MKPKPPILILLLAAALVVAVLGWMVLRGQRENAKANASLATHPPAPTAPPVDIQDGKTIDFSSGKAVVKNSAEDQAAMDAAVKEMDAATKGVVFGATATPPPAQKKADPDEGPPKP